MFIPLLLARSMNSTGFLLFRASNTFHLIIGNSCPSYRLLARVTSFLLHSSLPSSFPIPYRSLKYSSALKASELKREKREKGKTKFRDMEDVRAIFVYQESGEVQKRRQRPKRGASPRTKRGLLHNHIQQSAAVIIIMHTCISLHHNVSAIMRKQYVP